MRPTAEIISAELGILQLSSADGTTRQVNARGQVEYLKRRIERLKDEHLVMEAKLESQIACDEADIAAIEKAISLMEKKAISFSKKEPESLLKKLINFVKNNLRN